MMPWLQYKKQPQKQASAAGAGAGGYAGSEIGRRVGSAIEDDMRRNPERWEHPEMSKPWEPRGRDKG